MVERAEFPDEGTENNKSAAKEALDFLISVITWMVEPSAALLVKIYPNGNLPDAISKGGFVSKVLFDACLVEFAREHKNRTTKQRLLLLFLGLLIASSDTFDGATARACEERGIKRDSAEGLKLDTELDRWSIFLSQAASIAREFFQEKNYRKLFFMVLIFIFQILTDPGPSLLNALMKSKGKTEPKQADDLLGFSGTQIYRVLENLLRNIFPRLKMFGIEIPTVFITGTLGIIGNFHQMRKRKNIIDNPNRPTPLDREVREAAAESFEELKKIARLTIPVGLLIGVFILFLAKERDASEN